MTHETEIPSIQPPEKVREFRKSFRRGWTMRGVLLLLVGVAGVMMPFFSSFATVMTLAVMLGMAGISYAVSVFQSGTTRERLWDLLGAVVFLVAAFALFSRPLQGMAYVTLAVGIAFIAEGIVRGFWSATRRPEGWGWLVASSVASVILGGLILGQWPESGMYAVGTLMGLNFIFAAVACFVVASAMPKADAPMFDKVSDMASEFVEGARRRAEDLGDSISPQTHPPAPPRSERSGPTERSMDRPPQRPGVAGPSPHKPPPPPTLDDDDDFDE